MKINNIIITFFGVGKIPFAPGTFASLTTIPNGLFLFYTHPYAIYCIIVLLFVIGVLSSNKHQKITGKKDDSIIVIDEVVGQLIAMILAKDNFGLIILSFILFRIFDIFKPWPASYADSKIDGGFGVMLDDVFAGMYAAIIIVILKDFII